MELVNEKSEKQILLDLMRSGADQEKYFLRFYQGSFELAKKIYDDVLPKVGSGY